MAGQRVLMGGSTSWLRHADAVGTTTMTADQTGAVDSDVLYYPWGRLWANYNWSNGNVFGDLQYQINYPLPPSATRDYNPALGRWMTPDPMGGDILNPQSLNRYAYVDNNPATLNDPLGLQPFNPADPAATRPIFPQSAAPRRITRAAWLMAPKAVSLTRPAIRFLGRPAATPPR